MAYQHVERIAHRLSPYATGVAAVLGGDDSSDTLHRARREIAAFADRLVGRNRHIPASFSRAELIRAADAAYDELASVLAARGAL